MKFTKRMVEVNSEFTELIQMSNVNVNINMYTFACLRMYKITYPLEQNDPSIGKIRLQW